MNPYPGSVVIGYESEQSDGLLLLAADEASRRQVGLSVVTVLRHRVEPGLSIDRVRHGQALAEATALQRLHRAAVALRPSHPQVPVTTYCLGESEIRPDLEPMSTALLLVIGTQGRYGRQALTLDSVSRLLLTSSRCPLLIIPDEPTRPVQLPGDTELILVGVSEHPTDAAVVRTAYTEATRRAAGVLLLHAYSARPGETADQARSRARGVLSGYATHAPPGVRVSLLVTEADPATALAELSSTASLLVIGGRTGSLSGLVRDSVSRSLLQIVPCPILAVPRSLTADPPGPVIGITLSSTADTVSPSRPTS